MDPPVVPAVVEGEDDDVGVGDGVDIDDGFVPPTRDGEKFSAVMVATN